MKQSSRTSPGFTLIELLVVIGILSILLAITLVAVNPLEQTQRAQDVSEKATINDFIATTQQYFTSEAKTPWKKNTLCMDEITTSGVLSDMTNCLHEVTGGGPTESEYTKKADLKDIYVSKCGDTAVLCYNPKSKIENKDVETRYNKFGVNQPGCPGTNDDSPDCYWCRPAMQSASCHLDPTPTDTPTPTVTPIPTNTPTPTLTPTPSIPQVLAGYANDQSKFFKTYAVYFFDYPGFSPSGAGWNLHLSLNSDFSGDYTQTNLSFGIPSQYGPEGPANASYTAYRKITMKYVGFASTPSNTGVYSLSNCGKTLYYRIANYYNNSATNKLVGPTYTATFDCTTKVGVVDPPLSWYTVYDQLNNKQKQYDPSWDFDHSGSIDWTDYWLGAFATKTRYGGWQPPE